MSILQKRAATEFLIPRPRSTGLEQSRAPPRIPRSPAPYLFGLTLALLAWILHASIFPEPKPPKGDDGYYLRYMQTVANEGVSAFPRLVERWNASPTDSIFPVPTRVGYIVTTVVWGRIFGTTYRSLQTLSLTSFLLLCILNYVFARRRFGEPRAFFMAALLGFSPLWMGLSRLALSDSYLTLWMAASVWLFLEVLEDPGSARKRLLFMAVLAWMVLVKEIACLLAAPLLAFLLYERFARRIRHDPLRFALCFAVPAIVVVSILALAAGGVEPLWRTMSTVLRSPGTNRYAIRIGSGPWFRPLLDYLLLSPWTLLLAVGWFWMTASRLRSGRYDRESVYLGIAGAALLLVLSFFTKNVRYATVLDLPIRVFAVLLVSDLGRGLSARRAWLFTAGVVAILCWVDWRSFDLIWVQHQGYDPVTRFLAIVRKVIPP